MHRQSTLPVSSYSLHVLKKYTKNTGTQHQVKSSTPETLILNDKHSNTISPLQYTTRPTDRQETAMSFRGFLHRHRDIISNLVTIAFCTTYVIWHERTSRNSIRLELDGTEPKLDKTNEDLEAQTQCVQSMAVDSARHPMRAIDGDKKPLRQWLKSVERCQKSGGEDYDLVQKRK